MENQFHIVNFRETSKNPQRDEKLLLLMFKWSINAYPSVRNQRRGRDKVEYCPTSRTGHRRSSKVMEALLLCSGSRRSSCRTSSSPGRKQAAGSGLPLLGHCSVRPYAQIQEQSPTGTMEEVNVSSIITEKQLHVVMQCLILDRTLCQ